MSEKRPQVEKDEILELIRWIDKQKCKLFKGLDFLGGGWGILSLILLAVIPIVLAVSTFYLFVVVGTASREAAIALASPLLASLAVALSFFSLASKLGEEMTVGVNFKRAFGMRNDFTPKQKILLKALIKVKAKNPEFELEELYNEDHTLFTKEKLLERLYE